MTAFKLLPYALIMGLLPSAGNAADPIALGSFRSADLHLLYQYPANFVASDAAAKSIQHGLSAGASDRQDVKCFSIPLAAQSGNVSGKEETGLIVLMRIDNKCMGSTLDPENLGPAAQMLMQILKAFGPTMTEDAVAYKLDGHPAAFVQGTAQADRLGEGRVMHAGSVCTQIGQDTMCWLLMDSNHKVMSGLVTTPITFDGHSSVPLVPANLPKPW